MPLDIDTLRRRLQKALGKEFTVGALLGEGGFAAVFRVRDKGQQRDVAVKVLDLGVTRSSELAERFVREARTVAQLQHPHIVPIYKVGGYRNEVLYIVMRCLDGPSLRQLLEKYPRLSVGDAGRIARQVADALGHAHRLGVVHRDIKPDNILFDASGHVLVTDFGIAKAVEQVSASPLTTEGMVVGTPQYMSPEQATGERVDARADIYALGIVLYQMLAGTPPFDGESAQAILMKQATVDPPPLRRARRDVPPGVAAVVERMLAKDPAGRFQTAEEASAALVSALPAAARETVRVRPSAASVALRALAGLVLACATFLLAAGVVAYEAVSPRPRLLAGPAAPDSVVRRLRRDGALAADDAAEFVFVPGGGEDSTLLLISRRRVAVVTPGRVRSYPRDSVRVSYGMTLGRGVAFRLVLAVPGMRLDTAFRRLSLRDVYDAASRLRRLLSGPGAATRRTR